MSAFNYNIKLIRSLTEKNQKDFATLIKSKESNIKTWETTKSLPRQQAIYRRIADIAGVTIDDIKNKKLEEKDIDLKVEIVEKDNCKLSTREVIDDLREDKRRANFREDTILSQLVINSTAMMNMLTALQRHDQVFHETILRSLSRIEGSNTDLILEARKIEAEQQVQDSLKGSKAK